MVNAGSFAFSLLILAAASEAANSVPRQRGPFLEKRLTSLLVVRQLGVECDNGSG